MQIAYPPAYKELMERYLEVERLVTNEAVDSVDWRHVLSITLELIERNASFYPAWYVRGVALRKDSSWNKEIEVVRSLCQCNQKNFQAWNHRKLVVENLVDLGESQLSEELSSLNKILEEDPKNYHAWSFRIWLVGKFSLDPTAELSYSQFLVEQDPWNNSAWNYRYFLIAGVVSQANLDDELRFAAGQPENEARHSYVAAVEKLKKSEQSEVRTRAYF